MRTSFATLSVMALLAIGRTAFGVTDYYSTGPGAGVPDTLDDVWQSLFNGWGLDPNGDTDGDGCSNFVEMLAGTDPRAAGDCLKVGNMSISAGNVVFTFKAEAGKKYRILAASSPSPTATWTAQAIVFPSGLSPNTQFIPSDDNAFQNMSVAKNPGSFMFYKLEVSDADSDGDGVSDWDEKKLNTNPAIAENSGSGYNYSDTLHSMMSLTVSSATLPADQAAYESVDKTAGTNTTKAAKISLVRSWPPVGSPVPAMAINGITLTGASGAPDVTKSNATSGTDYSTLTINIPAGQGVTGSPYLTDAVTPVKDALDEVPEYATITAHLPVPGSNVVPGSATVCICDADPANPANNQLYVAYLGHEAGVATTASGYATALVNGDNTVASISVVFNNLSSDQNTAYIRSGPNNDLAPALPTGQVSGFNYNVQWKSGFYNTDQAFLSALTSSNIACAITTANYSDKEIWGYFNKASGSTTFNPSNPNLTAPNAGDPTFQTATAEQIERDIWRFMGQATWGGTTEMYNAIKAKVDAQVNALGGSPTTAQITDAYLQGLEDWLDEQMNPALTPTVNFRTLVMAGDNEDMALRGNKPVSYFSDPQINGARYTVTYDNAGNPTIGTTADTNTISNNYPISGPNRRREWWGMILQSKDQVRQRFTQALSEIVIISEADQTCADRHYGTANYWDMLAENAFGKYRTLLEKVSYSPMMGVYLSSMSNRARYETAPGSGIFISPDENYAREIMQLFSIGLVVRHPDGSLVLDAAGLPIATYDNNDITELARVMTGFSHGAHHAQAYPGSWSGTSLTYNNASNQRISDLVILNYPSSITSGNFSLGNNVWFGRDDGHLFWAAPWIYPMKLIGRISDAGATAAGSITYHDFNQYVDPATSTPVAGVSKRLFANKYAQYDIPLRTLPALGRGANDIQCNTFADADMTEAHNALAGDPNAATYPAAPTSYGPGGGFQANPGHTNTPVNMSRWLIQRLITSNPSSGYIYRVQSAYRSTNGNLGAVLKAILLDYEARSLQLADTSISHGKVKEPIVAFANMLRTLHAFSGLPISTLKDNPPSFSSTDSPLAGGYPQTEFDKFSTDNSNPPSLPTGWAAGPFRFRFNDLSGVIGQSPQRPPSVFNWFLPDFIVPGPLAEAGLFAPELQINTESGVVAKVNQFYSNTWSNLTGMTTQPGSDANISDMLLNNNMATPAVRFSLDNGATFVSSLTFTPANGTTPQNLTVVGANTSWLSNVDNSLLRFSVAGTGSGFDAIPVQPINIGFTDNDLPNEQILANHTSFSTWVQEGGKTDTVTVRLAAPPAADVTVSVATTSGQVSVSVPTLTFTSSNWNTDQTVTVSAANDNVAEAPGSGGDTLTFSAPGYSNISLPVGVVDSSTGTNGYDILITETGSGTDVTETTTTAVSAGIVDSFTVVLTKQPSANVTVTFTPSSLSTQIAMNSTGTTFVTTAVTRTFTNANWNTPQTVLVRGNDDTAADGNYPVNPIQSGLITTSITTSAGGYAAGSNFQPIGVTVQDNDNRIILAHSADGETRVSEDGTVTDTITVRLRTAPTAKVTVNLGSTQVKCSPTNLVFVPTGVTPGPGETLWSTAQTVTVTAVDDHVNEGLQRAWASPMTIPVIGTGTATVTSGGVSAVTTITNPGSHYVGNAPSVTFGRAATGNSGRTGSAVSSVTITDGGNGYGFAPNVTFSGGGGSGAAGTATINPATGVVTGVTITNGGTGYTSNPTVTFTHSGVTATGSAILTADGQIQGVNIINPGTGYFADPLNNIVLNVTLGPPFNTFAAITASATSDGIADTNYNNYWGNTPNGTFTQLYCTVIDNDNKGIVVTHSSGSTTVVEGGSTDTFDIALAAKPDSNVTVTLTPGTQVTASATTLTFTPANWNIAQTVTVTAVNDTNVEGDALTSIGLLVASSDAGYNGAKAKPVAVTVIDNDLVPLSIGHTNVFTGVAEGGTAGTGGTPNVSDTFTVQLPKAPTANVTVNLLYDSSQIAVSPTTITFTPTANQAVSGTTGGYNVNQTITVTAVDDAVVETTPHSSMIRFAVSSTDPFYNNPAHLPIFIPIKDNDSSGFSIVESSGNTTPTEGSTDSYTVVLTKQPPAGQNVVINVASNSPLDLQVSSTATFVGTNISVGSTNATTSSTVGLAPGMYISGTNIPAGTTVVTITNATTFVMSQAPTTASTGITMTANSVPAATAVLAFTNANWNTAQTITTTAVPDMVTEGREVTTISHTIDTLLTTDTSYTSVGAQTVNCFITDNHRRNESIIIIPSGGSIGSNETVISGGNSYVTEGDPATDSVDIYLSNAPQMPVTVSLTANAHMGFDKSTLIFDASNWNIPQTVQVSAVDDTFNDTYDVINGVITMTAQSQNLTATATAGDPAFFGVSASSGINILDNESPAVKIVQTGGITTTTEGGTAGTGGSPNNADTYTVVLTKQPNDDVVVRPVSASTTSGQTVLPSALTFTTANWNIPQTVTVTVANDTGVEGNHRSNISHGIRTPVAVPLSSCSTTLNSATVTPNTLVGLITGLYVVGPGIPANATIASINTGAGTFNLSANATATATGVALNTYGTSADSTGAVVFLTSAATNSSSTTITCASTTGLLPGTFLFGPGIAPGTMVASVTNGTSFVASITPTANNTGLTLAAITATRDTSGYARTLTNVSTTNGSVTVTCNSNVGLAAGMNVFGPGIPAGGTTIASVSTSNTTTFTLSAAAAATTAGQTLTTTIAGIQTVVNNITDNDNRIIIGVTGNDTRVHEDGSVGDTYTVVLRQLPTGNVTITPAAYFNNGASGFAATTFSAQGLSISPSTMTFTTANWNTPQTFTITGADNAVNGERARTVTIAHTSTSADAAYNNQSIHQVAVSVLAKDDARVLLIDNPGGNENGNTSTYRVAINRAPTSDVTIGLTADAQVQLAPPVPAGGTLVYASSANLTFTSANWNTFQTVTLRPVDDTLWEPTYNTGSAFLHTGTVAQAITSGDANFTVSTPAGLALMTITDNEVPAVRLTPSGGSTTVYEGGATDTYDVVLTTAPTADVTISVTPDAQSTVSPTSLTFTSGNWNIAQAVTITAVDDGATEGNHTSTITHVNAVSADPAYSGLPVPVLVASVVDNDGPRLVVNQSGGTTVVAEGGANDTISIALSQAPTANVTVTLVPPMYIIPVPRYAKQWGYYTTDLSGSNQNKERVVVDYTELILLYRSTFYGSLATAYGGSGNIPLQPSEVNLQNAHWAATKAIVDKTDLWWCGGSLKARNSVLVEPNQALPDPLPATNPRQVIMDCIYQLNGGANSPSTTRYLPQATYDPKNPPAATFDTEIRDRCRWIGYLNSTVMPGFVQH